MPRKPRPQPVPDVLPEETIPASEPVPGPEKPTKRARPPKVTADAVITPQIGSLGGLALNWAMMRVFGKHAQMQATEAVGTATPLMRIAARKIEKALPDGVRASNPDIRDASEAVVAFGGYLVRRFIETLPHPSSSEPAANAPPGPAPAAQPSPPAPAPGSDPLAFYGRDTGVTLVQ